jgi:hypothetical protein
MFGELTLKQLRLKGLIMPRGWAIAGGNLCAFYHPRQIKELKSNLKALKRKA